MVSRAGLSRGAVNNPPRETSNRPLELFYCQNYYRQELMSQEDDSFALKSLSSFNNTCHLVFSQNMSPCFGGKRQLKQDRPTKTIPLPQQTCTTKRVQEERRRVRQLQFSNTIQQQKIRQLEMELDTTTRSLELQIAMYKGMLAQQQQDKLKHIQQLQSSFASEMEKVLAEREEDNRVTQQTSKESAQQISGLLDRVRVLEQQLEHERADQRHLRSYYSKCEQEKAALTDRLQETEFSLRESTGSKEQQMCEIKSQLALLQAELKEEKKRSRQELDNAHDYLKEMHREELEAIQAQHSIEIEHKLNEMAALAKAYDSECKRYEETIESKDKFNSSLMAELERERDKIASLTEQHHKEVHRLNSQREHLLRDMEVLDNERAMLKVQCQQLQVQLVTQQEQQKEELWSESSVSCFGGKPQKKAPADAALLSEFATMKEILVESSRELQSCKSQFLRMSTEREQLLVAMNRNQEQIEHWKHLYFQLKHE